MPRLTSSLKVAGLGSALPASSTAVTEKACFPRASRYAFGDRQLAKRFLSSLHRKVELGSDEVNLNLAVAFLARPFGVSTLWGRLVILALGAVVSMVNSSVAAVGSALPEPSV